jgi:RNA polymerase sigma-70 factor (ECF subfamily)
MHEDKLLVNQALAGDEGAFALLFKKYYFIIYQWTLSFVKKHQDAEELTQDAFLNAYKHLPQLEHPECFLAWVQVIARNCCIDWLRKQEEVPVPLSEVEEVLSVPPVDQTLLERERLQTVMKAIDILPEKHRRLFSEHYLEGVSLKELQKSYGLSYYAVVNRLRRARQMVAEYSRKLLEGVSAFFPLSSWKSIFSGGIKSLNIMASRKAAVILLSTALTLGGAGFWVWHARTSPQAVSESVASAKSPAVMKLSGQISGSGHPSRGAKHLPISNASSQSKKADNENDDYSDYDAEFNDQVIAALEELNGDSLESLEQGISRALVTERDYSGYDAEMTLIWDVGISGMKFTMPVSLIGIPIDVTDVAGETSSFQPTPEEKRILDDLEKRAKEEMKKGNMERAKELYEEHGRIYNQCIRPGGAFLIRKLGGAGRTLSDGTQLNYSRRSDGALIRQVIPPGGQKREYIVNWASDILCGREHLPWEDIDEWIPEKSQKVGK